MKNAAVTIILKDGLILGISRRHDKTKFGLIGGKLDPNETAEQAAIRETFEETGIIAKKCHFVYERLEPGGSDGINFQTKCYYVSEWSGDIKQSEEGSVKWLTASELLSKEVGAFPEYNLSALNALINKFPFVHIKDFS